jgi:hypothetical protein
MIAMIFLHLLAAAPKPAGGAALDQVAIASAGALVASLAVWWLIRGHRSGSLGLLDRAATVSARIGGLPGWAALPTVVATASLLVALLGMYWDISLHIDVGRDAGPLANPAHYLILAGLYGVFVAGVLAMTLAPRGERPGPAPVRLTGDWYAPIGGLLIASAGAFALIGFPLDDMWHRLFGQDVTLWGPTHLMLIGGAGMTLIGQSVLIAEGLAAPAAAPRRRFERTGSPAGRPGSAGSARSASATTARRIAVMGGLLIGLSTFQAEFDFGVPQFRMVLHPLLIAVAASVALVSARLWTGPGGAIGAALFFLGVRGMISLLVGPVFGEITPALPLYLGEAVCVELAALALVRRPLAFGAAAGLLAGTLGIASEWPWTHAVMPLPWTGDILPEGLLLSAVGGVPGGLIGALLAEGLQGRLPRPSLARPAVVLAMAAIAACLVDGLITQPPGDARVAMRVQDGHVTLRVDPASLASEPAWITVTAWQGGGLHVDRLRRTGPATFTTTERVPLSGEWKAMVRVQDGRRVMSAPIFLPADSAIPVPEVPVRPQITRTLLPDHQVLQRERNRDAPVWLWTVAGGVVLAIALAFLAALSWGVGRLSRGMADPEPPAAPASARFERATRGSAATA